MSKAEFLIIVCTFIGAFVTIVAAIEKNIIRKLIKKDATSSHQVNAISNDIFISRWRFNRLKKLAVIIESSPDKYYYNESKYKILLKKRIITVITIIVIVLITAIMYFK